MGFECRALLLLYALNEFIPTFYEQLFIFWSKTQRTPKMEGVLFFENIVQVLNYFVLFSDSVVQKSQQTIIWLLLCYKRSSTVWQKYRKMSLQFCSVQQVVLNVRNRIIIQLKSEKKFKNQFLHPKFKNTSDFNWKFHNASDFLLILLFKVQILN